MERTAPHVSDEEREERAMMLEWVQRIAVAEPDLRRERLLEILREEELPFCLQRMLQGEHWVENIRIPFSAGQGRLILGAHYDNVIGSTAANDNASGVAVLLALAGWLRSRDVHNVELVFFDREEYGDNGSEAYLRSIGPANIRAMLNLDMCGFGDAIILIHKGNLDNPSFGGLLDMDALTRHEIRLVEQVPFKIGDDEQFQCRGVPNATLQTLPAVQADIFAQEALSIQQNGGRMSARMRELLDNSPVKNTCHNGPQDHIGSVSEESMQLVFQYLADSLRG